ncbi:MAG: MFS transporter [Eubacteriales bacterium]
MKNKAWLITIIVFLAGVVFSAGNYKVPATMVVVMEDMHTSMTMGGWLMSLGIVAGIILALPAGGIMTKTGPKKMGLFSLACALAGNVIGGLAPNFSVLMFGRLIEGIGFGLIGVVAPAIIAMLFPPEKRGLPMAVWTLWIGVGLLFIFTATNAVLPAFGWRGVWWLVAILAAIDLVLFTIFVQLPESEAEISGQEKFKPEQVSVIEGFKSPGSWLLGIIFGCYAFAVQSLITYIPTFMVQEAGMDVTTANMYSSVLTFGMIGGGITMGFVLSIVKKRTRLLLFSMLLTAIFMYLTFKVTVPGMIMPFMIAIGLVYSMLPPVIFTVAPDFAISPATIGVTMGIIILGQNLGGFVAPILIGAVVEGSGGAWNTATVPLLVVGIVGMISAILLSMVNKKKTVDNK